MLFPRRTALIFAALAGSSILFQSPHFAQAASTTSWTGNGAGANWSDGNNWNPTGTPGYGTLIFQGTNKTTNNNDLSSLSMHRIDLTGSSNWTLNGNAVSFFDFGGQFARIELQGTGNSTINFALNFNDTVANKAEINAVNADLTIGGAVAINNNVASLDFFGSGHTLRFNNVISGTGKALRLFGNNNLVFNAANTYSGDTFILNGTLQFDASGSAVNTTIRLGETSGTDSANVMLIDVDGGLTVSTTNIIVRAGSSGTKRIGSSNTSGTNTWAGNVFLDDDVTTTTTAGGSLTFANAGSFDIKNHKLTIGGAGTTTFSTVIGNSTASGSLLLNGTGTVALAGAADNTYGGVTTVNSGTLLLNKTSGDAIPAAGLIVGDGTGSDIVRLLRNDQINNGAPITVNSSGVLDVGGQGDVVGAVTINGGTVAVGSGSISASGGLTMTGGTITTSGSLALFKLGAGANLTNSGTSPAFIAGSLSLNGSTRTFTVNDSGTGVVDALISAKIIGTTAGQGIIKAGAGTLQLSGPNTFDGGTTINAGTLLIGSDGNLGAVPATPTTNVILGGGALANTAAVTIDVNRSFSLTAPSTVAANGAPLTINGAVSTAGNRIIVAGTDVTTINGAISGAADVLKQSTGTLRLTNAANSFGTAGGNAAFIDNGSVELSASGALGTTNGTTTGLINLGTSAQTPSGGSGATSLVITTPGVTIANPIDARFFNVGTVSNQSKTIGATNATGVATFSGNISLHDSVTISAATGGTLQLTGPIANGATNGTLTTNGAPGVTKSGGGVLTLTNTNTYSGTTAINSGTVIVNGSLSSGGGAVNVNNTGALGGTGTVSRDVNVNTGGTISPGNSIGNFNINATGTTTTFAGGGSTLR